MPHNFEAERPDHKIHNVSIPRGHGHMDQKLEKGMRSPLMGQLPIDSGIQGQENAPGISPDEGSL